MSQTQIVIFTSMGDAHADVMVKTLGELGHEPVRLNSEDLPGNAALRLGLDSGRWAGGLLMTANGRSIDLEAVRSVWVRRPFGYGFPADLLGHERAYATAEMDHALGGLWESLDCYWMSRPSAIRAASWKGEQLQRAAELGFEVPKTLITNDPEAVRAFHAACGERMVFKSMVGPAALAAMSRVGGQEADEAPPEFDMATTLVGDEQLADLESVRVTACLFQEYIPKDVELRVTVIGDDVFAAEIHSQTHPRTEIDYRDFEVDIPYRKARLPEEIAGRCVDLVRGYGLTFGAIDLIRTPDGRHVFIENNPTGQFMFVERLVPELRMTEALAACLIRGADPR